MKITIHIRIILAWLILPTILTKFILDESFAIALEIDNQNSISLIVNSDNNLQIASNRESKLYEVEKSQSQALLKQTLKNAKPNSQQTKQLPKLIIAEVIPIEDFKVQPPKPPEQGEDEPEADTTQPSKLNENRPYTQTQEILIQKLRQAKKQQQDKQKEIVLNALTFSANKYSWIVNPTDNITFNAQLFKPNENENYIDTNISVRDSQDSQIIDKFTYANFPKNDQFYWVTSNNRLVFETKGSQAGILYQGRQTDTYITQNVTSSQAFWGLQTLVSLPPDFEALNGEANNNELSLISVAGQVINPEGVPAGRVVINSGVDLQSANVTVLENRTPIIGSGSTYSPDGGGALFQALDASNTPQIIQGFPTIDLKPLLDEGNIRLQEGEIIPNNVLEAAGIFWGDIITGKGFGFSAPVTSAPGIKVAQRSKFDNFDLLNIAVNPFLSPTERDLHYLNSLFWVSFGKRTPISETLSEEQDSSNWYRFYVSYPHNRSILQYDTIKISATYSNIFAAPGLSITANLSNTEIDAKQTINSTLGMALGGIFEAIQIEQIDQSLVQARQEFENGEGFSPLKTTATPFQRRQINQRLNRTLAYANSASGLAQVSGTFTLPSKINPNESNILQVRTGNHRRAVQFLERDIELLDPGDTYFSNLSLSNEKFGPLTFAGIAVPLDNTSISPINEASAAQIILTDSQGRQFIQSFSSNDNTVVPLNVRTFDLAFDYMEFTRVDKIGTSFKGFSGELLLPTIELLTAGSSGDFNYSANLGTWFNIDANSAPGVANNNLGLEEPTVGIYTNVLLNYIKTYVQFDSAKKPVAIDNHVPFLKITWNSASSRNNPFTTFLSYFFEHQEKKFGYSLAPGIAFVQDNSNGELLVLFNGQFSTSSGLNLKTSFEIGKETFFEIQGLHKIVTNFSLGTYIKNYSVGNRGLSNRVSGFNYGGILKYNFPDNNVFIETRIGTGDSGFELQLQGGYRF
ncbi:hypothetical protein FNW02_17615 [Komarekiella sp. 'clone 1']|uniref:Uncharacterized protein n=1 Tax=Komarekiella delphini-convector SJRDD-AB1 TaxID=2593771 RepID=A0AA40VSM8_9NOST|nr:hypothetical protein [Komarekiella delphini-convector SJRDD-AB1]